jgi:YHS domain-containing protein
MRSLTLLLAMLVVFAFPSPLFAGGPELALDPIELLAGREVQGAPELTLDHDGIRYHFATAENKATFEKRPASYEVADGGACGSMGPLSGLGNGSLFTVHDGRIYFFASAGCKATFLKDPAKCIELPQPPPTGSSQAVTQGLAAFDRMLAWAGGDAVLATVHSYLHERTRTVNSGGIDYKVVDRLTVSFPDNFKQFDAWNDSAWATVAAGDKGSAISKGQHHVLARARREAFLRDTARAPITLLKARHRAGFTAIYDGEGTHNSAPVDYVLVGWAGATSRLTIAKSDGKLLELAFTGRDGTPFVGRSVRTYTEYATTNGVTLPIAWTVTFDDKPRESLAIRYDTLKLNPELLADEFATGD